MNSAAPKPRDPTPTLERIIGALPSAVIALSGGVDSSLVAVTARQLLGRERVLAVTGQSHSLSTAELTEIQALCDEHDIAHEVVATHELSLPEYQKNAPDRCFHCKNELYGTLRRLADAKGLVAVLDGTHLEDLSAHRPSLKAAAAHNVTSPLVDAGMTKADVRAAAAALGLTNAARPAQPCLSSRIAYGLEVNAERLDQVEQAEAALRALGFARLRVRHHDAIARIEVPQAQFGAVMAQHAAVERAVRAAGFTYVTLDLRGLRSGSLLEVLNNGPGKGAT